MGTERIKKLNDVFGTSRDVPETYIERPNIDERFLNDITRDKHIVIHGSSKQGKTCLRKFHLGQEDYVVVQCTRETTKSKLYELIFKQANIPCEVSSSKTLSGGFKLKVTLGAEGKIPFFAKGKVEGGGEYDKNHSDTKNLKEFDIDPEDANDVSRLLTEAKFEKYIVIEDFHYLSEEVQRSLSIDLKVFHENSKLIFIIVGVWLEANRLTLYNGDLTGRMAPINVDTWNSAELGQVIEVGEGLLNISFSEEIKESIIDSCQNNVGLLQEIVYRICEKYSIWTTQDNYQQIGKIEDVHEILKLVSEEQSTRYLNFLSRFAEGLGKTQLQIYKWILVALIKATPLELRIGLRPNVLFQRIKEEHPSADTLQQGNITQALERVATVQFKHKLQPLILDYSNGELVVVDVNFVVFLQSNSTDTLMEYINFQTDTDDDSDQLNLLEN